MSHVFNDEFTSMTQFPVLNKSMRFYTHLNRKFISSVILCACVVWSGLYFTLLFTAT
jgi:hypothetical protein